VALVDVAARIQQQLEALGVAVLGGNVNRRTAVVVALVDVAAR
jgi:selenophosphate synthetase-related protein